MSKPPPKPKKPPPTSERLTRDDAVRQLAAAYDWVVDAELRKEAWKRKAKRLRAETRAAAAGEREVWDRLTKECGEKSRGLALLWKRLSLDPTKTPTFAALDKAVVSLQESEKRRADAAAELQKKLREARAEHSKETGRLCERIAGYDAAGVNTRLRSTLVAMALRLGVQVPVTSIADADAFFAEVDAALVKALAGGKVKAGGGGEG